MTALPRFTLLVTGSRDAISPAHSKTMEEALKRVAEHIPPDAWQWHLVHGAAPGADSFCAHMVSGAMEWCGRDRLHPYPYAKGGRGKEAGGIRNQMMVDYLLGRQRLGDRVGCVAFPAHDLYARWRRECSLESRPGGYGGTCDCLQRVCIARIGVSVVPLDVSEERSARLARSGR